MEDDWNNNAKVMVYIDNSNIFISTQKHSARKKKFFDGVSDSNCRIDVGKLVNEAKCGRDIIHGKLYGSEPPVLDTVWKAIREKKIQVNVLSKKDTQNRKHTKLKDTRILFQFVNIVPLAYPQNRCFIA